MVFYIFSCFVCCKAQELNITPATELHYISNSVNVVNILLYLIGLFGLLKLLIAKNFLK